ncbi:hypothetical protein CMPELA_08695 [Cupriavidus necator]
MCDGRRSLQPGHGKKNSIDDVLIPGAAAQVAVQRFPDIAFGRRRLVRKQRSCRKQHSWRTEATLQAMKFVEGLLEHGCRVVVLHAFNRVKLAAVSLGGKYGARLHVRPVDKHRAGSALGGVATDVNAGQAFLVPQQVHQQPPWLYLGGTCYAIDGVFNFHSRLCVSVSTFSIGTRGAYSITIVILKGQKKFRCSSQNRRAHSAEVASEPPGLASWLTSFSKREKNSARNLFATDPTRRDPICASFPPICAAAT